MVEHFCNWMYIPPLRCFPALVPPNMTTRSRYCQKKVRVVLDLFVWDSLLDHNWVVESAKAEHRDLDVVEYMHSADLAVVLTNCLVTVHLDRDKLVELFAGLCC
jgi:hypothetical protein